MRQIFGEMVFISVIVRRFLFENYRHLGKHLTNALRDVHLNKYIYTEKIESTSNWKNLCTIII